MKYSERSLFVKWPKNEQPIPYSELSREDSAASREVESAFRDSCDVGGPWAANRTDGRQHVGTKEFALRGKRIALYCDNAVQLHPFVRWYRNRQLIQASDYRARVDSFIGNLVIKPVDFADEGVYTCEVLENGRCRLIESRSIELEVLSPPYFTIQPKSVIVGETKMVEFRCEAHGAPKPAIKWMRNGEELTGERYDIASNGSLRIQDVSVSDSGEYTCRATNEYGTEDAAARLVFEKYTKFIDQSEDREVVAGETVIFRCNAVAFWSSVRISWLKDEQPIDFEYKPRIVQRADNSLMIVKTNSADSGTYTCVASTEVDEARAQATLVVHGEPKPPRLLGITCGSNEAQITWVAAEDEWSPILHFSVEYNTSFTPDTWETMIDHVPATEQTSDVKLSPWANYTFRVIAWNEHGPSKPSSHSSVCSTIFDVPYKNPDNVRTVDESPTTLVIKWTVMPQIEHHAINFMYRVYWKRDVPGEEWIVEDIHDWRTNYLKRFNQPTYQRYKIKVIAVNIWGESTGERKEVIGYSGEDRPLVAPANFTLEKVISNTTALFSWSKVPDESVRGRFRVYKIDYTSPQYPNNRKMIETNETHVLIDSFRPNRQYFIGIRACNGRYDGPRSKMISFTPK